MAQSTTTVTPANPTPPTNFSSVGARPPNIVPNYTKNTYAETDNWGTGTNSFPPPFFDDGITAAAPDTALRINENVPPSGVSASPQAFAANTSALASGTSTTSGGTENTYPGTGTAPFNPNMVGPVPASSSSAHEEAGNVITVTAAVPNPSPFGQLKTVSTGPALTAGTLPSPNQLHASTMSPAGTTTLASISPSSTTSGGGTVALTCTGTNFTTQSVIYVNGVAQTTTFVSSTSLTATVTKKSTAGTWPVAVITGGTVTTVERTLTFT